MNLIPSSVEHLIEDLGRLPGVGPRTAERLAIFLLKGDTTRAEALGSAIVELHKGVRSCKLCHIFSEEELCPICSASNRQTNTIAVVEEPFDIVALEKTGRYSGLYHVLGGVMSPLDGVGADKLEIASLLARLRAGGVDELILATNPTVEGESTGMYIRQQLGDDSTIKITRLARGLPVGGDLEYADHITLGRALDGREIF
jgi:recombination protein RecR